MHSRLNKIKKKYSGAPYSFLRISNIQEEYEKYQTNYIKIPSFTYSSYFSADYLNRRLKNLLLDRNLHEDDKEIVDFIEKRIVETEFLQEILSLRNGASHSLQSIREYNRKFYATLSKILFRECLEHLRLKSIATNREKEYEYISSNLRINSAGQEPFKPNTSQFNELKRLFDDNTLEIINAIYSRDNYHTADKIQNLAQKGLYSIGAVDYGWKTKISPHGSGLMVSKHNKLLIVSNNYKPSSRKALIQVLMHEILGHVNRSLKNRVINNDFIDDEEGLALMIEQLTEDRFIYKRMIRYIAVSLAWGIDGVINRSFTDVYSIVLRVVLIVKGCDEEKATKIAFFEVARAFRGAEGCRGYSYNKDAIYFESNLRMWRYVISQSNPGATLKTLLMI